MPFRDFNAYRYKTNLKEAARDISSDIYLFKQRAVAENREYRINFISAISYTIQQETVDVNGVRTGNYVSLITKTVGAGNANIVISNSPSFFPGGVTYVRLDPRGTSGNGTIVLTHNISSSTTTITINPMGRANVTYNPQ